MIEPSIPHHDVRGTLIARAQAEYPNDRYRKCFLLITYLKTRLNVIVHPDPTDGLPHSETAFYKPHQNRGPDRQDCADILFEVSYESLTHCSPFQYGLGVGDLLRLAKRLLIIETYILKEKC